MGVIYVRSVFVSSLHSASRRLARALASTIAISPLVLASPAVLAQSAAPSPFVPSANCNLSAPAFCETFNQGPSAIRGRGGDLDPSKWATARLSGEIITSGQGTANPVPIAPAPPCRAGITQTSVFPPNDTLICDPSGTKSAQLMTAVSMQNYGVNSYMVRQPFDFAGRTGKIDFDVDAVDTLLGGIVEIEITQDAVPATTFREFNNYEAGPAPRNGLSIKFLNDCGSTGAAPVNTMVYNNYVGTIIAPTFNHVQWLRRNERRVLESFRDSSFSNSGRVSTVLISRPIMGRPFPTINLLVYGEHKPAIYPWLCAFQCQKSCND